ncbi:MAG: hypothetical protein NT062_37850 [Proteobacteria bacterium]|nr:hypothetical protein [Pseudomonadota bacterium]
MSKLTPKFKLRITSIKFCSVVDFPAQPNATTLLIKRAPTGDEITATARLAKVSDELGLCFFWAFMSTNPDGTPHADLQGDVVDPDFMKAAMDFMTDGGGAVDEMHDENPEAGKVIFCMPMDADIAAAFGLGDVKTSGLMVALKPSPSVLAKLKSGELGGVSISGSGIREPLVGDADPKVEAKLAAHRADLAKQADTLASDLAYEHRVVAESVAYLDGMVASHGDEFARAIAKRNITSVGSWGQVWLTANPVETIAKAAPSPPAGVDAIVKREATLDAMITAYAKARGVDRGTATDAVLRTTAGKDAYNAIWEEKSAPVAAAAKPFDVEIAKLTASMTASIESFSLAQNLDLSESRARLERISPAFAATSARISELYTERSQAMYKAECDLIAAWNNRGLQIDTASKAVAKAADDQRDVARKAHEPEAYELEQLAKARAAAIGCSVVEAYGDIMDSARGLELYRAAEHRKSLQRAGAHVSQR